MTSQGHLDFTDLTPLSAFSHLTLCDLYHVHEETPFKADLSLLPPGVKLLGLQVSGRMCMHLHG